MKYWTNYIGHCYYDVIQNFSVKEADLIERFFAEGPPSNTYRIILKI